MKIGIINNLYKPYARGGAERIVEIIAGGLIDSGYEVFIIATKPYIGQSEPGDNNIYFLNSLFYNLNDIPKPLRLIWHLLDVFSIRRYYQVRSILRREKPDIVITHNLKGVGMLIPRAVSSLGIRHIHTLHDIQLLHPSGLMIYGQEQTVDSILSKIYQRFNQLFFKYTEILISPSKWLLDEHLRRKFFKNANNKVILNPIINNFALGSNFHKAGAIKFLYAGQIEDHKGVLFLIEVFKDLIANNIKNVELVVAGDGSRAAQARKIAKNCRQINLIGKVAREEILKLMEKSDCLVVPSLCYENSPTVIYEALSCGLPVIASRLGGIKELIADSHFLFKPANKKDLALKLIWIINNKKNLVNQNKKNQLISGCLIDNYIKALIKLF